MNEEKNKMDIEIDKAIKTLGKPASYFVRTLLEGQIYFASCEEKILDQELGLEKSEELRNKIWSLWAEEQGKAYRKEFEKQGVPADARLLGKMFRKWFEDNWLVTYEIVEDTPDRHEGKITNCLDEIMAKHLFGATQKLFDYDHIYAASQMEINTICKAANLHEEFNCSFTGFLCTGDCCDRIIFERKKR